ncbi:MAG: Ig-like domain-containing protein [Gemmatimonadaceae bacterium]
MSPSSATDSIGHSTSFSVTVYDRQGRVASHGPIHWNSRDSTIVNIDNTGRARRLGVGKTTVTVTVDSLSANAPTTALGVPIASISISPNPASATVGQSTQFTATARDSSGNALTGRPVVWLSSAPAVEAVDTTGKGTAMSTGSATISATSAGILGVTSETVAAPANPPGAVADLAAVASSATSATLSFTAVGDGTGGNANYEVRYAVHPISWGTAADVASGTCSTPVTGYKSGAAVNCTVTGLSPATNYDFQAAAYRGTINTQGAVFGAISNVATATTPSAPAASVAKVVVSPTSVTDTVGQHSQFSASVQDSAGNVLTGRTVTWSTSASGVATVNSSGYTSSVGIGAATITATSSGVLGNASVTVNAPPVHTVTSVAVAPSPDTLAIGATKQLTATIKDQNGATMTGLTVSWSSNTTSVATVNSSGLVTAVTAGTATITGSNGGKSGTATVVVTSGTSPAPPPPAPTGTDEPSYNAASDAMVYSDNMDAYTSIALLQATHVGSGMYWTPSTFGLDAGDQVVSPGFGGSGYALRQAYSGAYQDAHDWDLNNIVPLPDTTTHFFQYEGRVTMGSALGSQTLAVKWFMAFHRDGTRVQWDTHDHLPCSAQASGVGTYWEVYDKAETSCQGNQPVGPYPAQIFDGQWHRFTYEYRPNTAAGSRDGIARMWVDGVKVIDVSAATVGVTPPGGYKPWCQWDDVDALSTQGIDLIRWASAQTTTTSSWTYDMDNFLWWHAK